MKKERKNRYYKSAIKNKNTRNPLKKCEQSEYGKLSEKNELERYFILSIIILWELRTQLLADITI